MADYGDVLAAVIAALKADAALTDPATGKLAIYQPAGGTAMGAFTRKAHERNPSARLFAIEAHPDNMACLAKNAGAFATLLNVALTYEGAVGMTDSIHADNPLSGGNTVLPIAEILADTNPAYERFTTPLPTITLEELIAQHNIDYIDVMKMDCEGSEYSILGKTSSLAKIGIIIGEYHCGINRFKQLVADRFPLKDWWHYMWNPSPQHYENIGYFWLAKRSPPPYAS
jgi:FkbM family methyltransferase